MGKIDKFQIYCKMWTNDKRNQMHYFLVILSLILEMKQENKK